MHDAQTAIRENSRIGLHENLRDITKLQSKAPTRVAKPEHRPLETAKAIHRSLREMRGGISRTGLTPRFGDAVENAGSKAPFPWASSKSSCGLTLHTFTRNFSSVT